MKTTIRSIACLMALACFSLVARAGVVIQQEGGEVGANKPKQKSTLYLDSGKIRMESVMPDGKKTLAIFDGDKQVLWSITPEEGSYMEMNAAQVSAMADQMSSAMKQMESQMANMPPEQRKMMEDMMKKSMGGGAAAAPPTVTVQEKGSGEKVGAFTTTHYDVLSNGQRTSEVWAASTSQVHLQESDFNAFKGMAKLFEPLTRNAPRGATMSGSAMEQIKGFPVKTVMYDGPRATYESTVLSVEQKSLEGSLFTLPTGLKKIDMMNPGMRGRGRP